MYKKYASVLVGAALLATPLIASAQAATDQSEASLIATLQQLIVILTQELQQLIAAKNAAHVNGAVVSISGITPSSASKYAQVKIFGTGFAPGDIIQFNGLTLVNPGYIEYSSSDGSLAFTVPDTEGCVTNTGHACVAQGIQPGTYSVSVRSPQGQASNNISFIVTGQTSDTLTAAPTTGAAPLSVMFSVPVTDSQYNIDFGDGSAHEDLGGDCGPTLHLCTTFHTYAMPGVYTVQLDDKTYSPHASATITVTGGSSYFSATCHGTPYNSGTPGISWASTPIGGLNPYTYQWTLSNDVVGTGISNTSADLQQQNLLATYASTGLKGAIVLVNSGALSFTAGCTATIAPQGSATITSPTVQYVGSANVSGTFANTDASSAIVVLVSQPYAGSTSWNTVGGYLQGSTYATSPVGNRFYSYSSAVTGPNHQFSVGFSNVPAGSYSVLVYTGTYGSQSLLTQGTVTIQ